eukprot:TRINITY_DN8831_c0_g1_i1.p1 TRINITY_DN8831_c0_g1~~TRINITY_DN8831_c0_g1_i1.p1  ORF type:complete len:457 (+),score=112.07 TRINITY_DN8831_c0_g1_i1:103-1473(+)
MDLLGGLFGLCSTAKSGSKIRIREEDASPMQLNAFEFRNYQTVLETPQQKLVERVVNQWCAMLVKGKTLKVNDFEEKIYLDRDMLNLEHGGELFPLSAIQKMEMFLDTDDMMMEEPWGIDISFEFAKGSTSLRFNFAQERHRLGFALTLRILRTRDPTLDTTLGSVEVCAQDDEREDDEDHGFNKLAVTHRFNVDEIGIPIIISVTDFKITQRVRSTSRHVYLELFVNYPKQDKFLYAKSSPTHLDQKVLAHEEIGRKVKKDKEDEEEAELRRNEEVKIEVLCTMKFDLKNVKIKIPKVPHKLFGRLMAKDDYFPTAVGTFEFEVKKTHLQDKRLIQESDLSKLREQAAKRKRRGLPEIDGLRIDPENLQIPVIRTFKLHSEPVDQVGTLDLRLIGFVTKPQPSEKKEGKAKDEDADEDEDVGEGEEEEDGEDDEEVDVEGEEEEGGEDDEEVEDE